MRSAVTPNTNIGFSSVLLDAGELSLPHTLPEQKSSIDLPGSVQSVKPGGGDVYLTVSVKLRATASWAAQGHEVAWFQYKITGQSESAEAGRQAENFAPKPRISISGPKVTIHGPEYQFVFDTARGFLCSWVANGQELLQPDPVKKHAIVPSFWRPATDNDVPQSLPYWQRFAVDQLTSQLKSIDIDSSAKDQIRIRAKTFLTPPVLAWGWECDISYIVTAKGTLQAHVHQLKPKGPVPKHIPRIGLNLRMNKSFDQVKWCGRGPGESYPDKAASQQIGIWATDSIDALQTPYDVPQENGNRMDTQWVKFGDSRRRGTAIRVQRIGGSEPETFSFVASRHSAETIQAAKHPNDLVEEDALLVRLDYKVAGVGTAACGPGVRPDLLVKCEEASFAFELAVAES